MNEWIKVTRKSQRTKDTQRRGPKGNNGALMFHSGKEVTFGYVRMLKGRETICLNTYYAIGDDGQVIIFEPIYYYNHYRSSSKTMKESAQMKNTVIEHNILFSSREENSRVYSSQDLILYFHCFLWLSWALFMLFILAVVVWSKKVAQFAGFCLGERSILHFIIQNQWIKQQ